MTLTVVYKVWLSPDLCISFALRKVGVCVSIPTY